jgi:hypothetical protein
MEDGNDGRFEGFPRITRKAADDDHDHEADDDPTTITRTRTRSITLNG